MMGFEHLCHMSVSLSLTLIVSRCKHCYVCMFFFISTLDMARVYTSQSASKADRKMLRLLQGSVACMQSQTKRDPSAELCDSLEHLHCSRERWFGLSHCSALSSAFKGCSLLLRLDWYCVWVNILMFWVNILMRHFMNLLNEWLWCWKTVGTWWLFGFQLAGGIEMLSALLLYLLCDSLGICSDRKRRGAINAKQLAYLEKYHPKSRLKNKNGNGKCVVM